MITKQTEVLVVGSGFGALAPALRLALAGLQVTILEKGPRLGPEDFRQTQDPKYLLKYLKGIGSEHLGLTYAEALGGGSGFYEMVSLRAPSVAFEQSDSRGARLWPTGVTRATLDPWYDIAEGMLHVEQIREDQVPRSGQVFAMIMARLGYSCDRARYAVQNCLGSGFCVTGCLYGAKQSLHANYLPRALAAGATVQCDTEALEVQALTGERLARSGNGPLAPRYRVRCRTGGEDGRKLEYLAGLVILGGGTVGTARLLLASAAGLPNLSEHVGRHIAFNGSVKAAGILPDDIPDADMYAGRSHPGMISYEFLDSRGITISTVKPLPVQMMAAGRLRLADRSPEPAWWGPEHVALMKQVRHRMIILLSLGLTPPAGRLTLDAQGEPKLGLEGLERLADYEKSIEDLLSSILKRSGCRPVAVEAVDRTGMPHPGTFFSSAHQTGSCRMADSASRGVVDVNGELFGHPGLFVSDGAAIPSSLAVNTSLTILANAERIAAGIAARYGRAPAGGPGDRPLVARAAAK
jgi:enediyne biosynthesis protein E9